MSALSVTARSDPDAARKLGVPLVECHRRAKQPHWADDIWVISKCPYCGKRHVHGAGEGLRTSHCLTGPGGSYYLIKKKRVSK